ncbi:MAG: NHL repeat-containing protein, partial [Planctomycetota bacterium]|jgi:hypothetical protein
MKAKKKLIIVMTLSVLVLVGFKSKKLYLLVSEQKGVSKVDTMGRSTLLLEGSGRIRTMEGELFKLHDRQIIVTDMLGKELRRIPVPKDVRYAIGFIVIPDGRLAFLDNQNDTIYFTNAKGEHLKTVTFNDEPSSHWQHMDGVAIDNKLVVSENGNNQLISVDLSTYQLSIFRDLTNLRGGLGTITYADGEYYICQRKEIYAFSEDSEGLRKIASTPEYNITGIAHAQGRLFVVVNGMSRIKERSLAAKYRTTQGGTSCSHKKIILKGDNSLEKSSQPGLSVSIKLTICLFTSDFFFHPFSPTL